MLLHMVAKIDPNTPVLFLNTGKLFGETLRYRDRLQDVLGLTDLRSCRPASGRRARARSRRHAVVARHRCLLRFPQGRAAEARAGGFRRTDHRPQALPDQRARADDARQSNISTAASASIRWPTGRSPISKPTRRRTSCRAIRWSRTAIPPSAACPARAASRRARAIATAAGPASTRTNAASISAWTAKAFSPAYCFTNSELMTSATALPNIAGKP